MSQHQMTPEPEEARARVLLTALGFAFVALVAVGGLLALGLNRMGAHDVIESPSPATVSALNGERTQERRASAVGARNLTGDLFAPSSVWNKRLANDAPIDANSAALVQAFTSEIQRERGASIGPWIGAGAGSTPVYRVAADQRRVRVRLDTTKSRGAKALRRAFASVPIPQNAKPAPGLDGHLTVWQPSTDRLWEFFHAHREGGAWHADWGGAIRNVSKSPGYYTASAWPGATRNWGATASSLPIIGGTILLDELKRGRIDHALALNLPAPRAGEFSWPAQRTDGTGPATALPEGARIRLDPTVNVNDLGLPKLGQMIARAAQRYGMVVRDQTHHATSLWAEVTPGSSRGLSRYLKGKTPAEVLANFPWDRMQVLRMNLCTAAPCRAG
jgi:hypothetical protein